MNVLELLEADRKMHGGALVVVPAATLTLTAKQILGNKAIVTNESENTVITIPPAAEIYNGVARIVSNKAAYTAKLYVAAGYGGAGASYDTITLAQRDAAIIFCDGLFWYAVHHTTAGSS